jgi:hypothetical protein
VAANFFELDFAMVPPTLVEGTFTNLTEKIVLELTLKVLQNQQLNILAAAVVPSLFGLTPPPG